MELTCNNILKKYRKKIALQDFNLTLTPGIYGLLGPNGAGKSTLINILVGNMSPTYGEVWYNGIPIHTLGNQYRKLLGYLPQSVGLYKNFTGKDMLLYFAALKGITSKKEAEKKTDSLLEMVNLKADANRKIGQYSGGMKQRIGIAQALLGDPSIIIFDEPTAGLDPKERIRFMNILSEQATNRIILLATHIVSDVEQIANQIIFIKEGNLLMNSKTEECTKVAQGKVWTMTASHLEYEKLAEQFCVSQVFNLEQGMLQLTIVSERSPHISACETIPSLKDVYMFLFEEATI